MDGVSSVSGGIRPAQIAVEYQARVLAKERAVIQDVGNAALKLIASTFEANQEVGQRLDLIA